MYVRSEGSSVGDDGKTLVVEMPTGARSRRMIGKGPCAVDAKSSMLRLDLAVLVMGLSQLPSGAVGLAHKDYRTRGEEPWGRERRSSQKCLFWNWRVCWLSISCTRSALSASWRAMGTLRSSGDWLHGHHYLDGPLGMETLTSLSRLSENSYVDYIAGYVKLYRVYKAHLYKPA